MAWPIGKTWDMGEQTIEAAHAADYAAATGDDSPAYRGPDAIAPPMLHVRLMKGLLFAIATDPELGLDMLRLVHGGHGATFHAPLRVGEVVRVHGELLEVQEKSSGLLVSSAMYADVGGQRRVSCTTQFFIRAKAPPTKGPRKPRPAAAEPPPPDFQADFQVPEDASYVYARASLDDNPIHVDPEVARSAGLPDVILQGLCTMAMTVREGVAAAAGGDPRRLRYAGVRFARPVLNGMQLRTRGWKQPDGSWAVETLGPDGKAVIDNAMLRFDA